LIFASLEDLMTLYVVKTIFDTTYQKLAV